MLEKLMPKSDEFFDDFDAQADATVRGAKLLCELLDDFTDVERKVQAIKEVEHQGDAIAHRAFERLHRQFITPFDRAEIHRLLGRIDDVLDLTDATAERLLLYEVGAVPQAAKDLARVLVPCSEKLQEAVRLLREIKNPAQILAACREIKGLESAADALGRAAIAALFKSGADALSIMKWKEIYDLMETATDRCEDVANVIEGVVLEHAQMLGTVIALVVLALIFDFINGFHDAANSIATVVSTRVLSPGIAVLWAAFFNFIAAFGGGVKVANTMGKGIIHFDLLRAHGTHTVLAVIFAALIGAIVWDLVTWWWGIPSSSSHALAGGLIGAALPSLGWHGLVWDGIGKICLFIVLSPVIGTVLGAGMTIGTAWIVRRRAPLQVDKWFRRLQLVSSGIFSYSHGTGDAQKTMGIIAVILYGTIWANRTFEVPFWVILLCHAAMGLGTAAGGWRIVRTMGHNLTKLQPIGGFCAETGGGVTILAIAKLGIPVSTTHTITGAIVGVGSTKGARAVRWGVAGRIVWAWILTIPASALVAALMYAAARPLLAALF